MLPLCHSEIPVILSLSQILDHLLLIERSNLVMVFEFLCMYICIYLYLNVSMYISISIYTSVRMSGRMDLLTYVHMSMHMSVIGLQ